MNKVFLSGMIAGDPAFVQPQASAAYLTFVLAVRHKNAKGMVKQALYRINAWNNAAVWGNAHLHKHQQVALEGYLTQRSPESASGFSVEITAETFLPGFCVSTPLRPASSAHDSIEATSRCNSQWAIFNSTSEQKTACEKDSTAAREAIPSANNHGKEAVPLEI